MLHYLWKMPNQIPLVETRHVAQDDLRFGVRPVLAWLGFVLAFAIAAPLDVPISTWAHDSGVAGFLRNHERLAHVVRFPGHFGFTLIATFALLIAGFRRADSAAAQSWRNAALVMVAGVLSGVNAAFKWCIGRTRPFHNVSLYSLRPFRGGFSGLIHAEQNLSFPSGDCSLAFAMSATLCMILPRLWPLWWLLGIVVALERIAENAHYPTDTVAGAALGVAVAVISRHAVQTFWRTEPSINDPPGTTTG
jgi:membrane-associated phospholipid phosphatase